MIRLKERNEWLANHLVNDDSDKMFAAVVVGNNPGEVWVDNPLNLASALVWSDGLEGFNFMGNARNALFNQSIAMWLNNEMIPFLKSRDKKDFEFSVDSEEWYPTLYEVMANREIHKSFQYVFKSNESTNDLLSTEMLEPYKAVEINEALFHELKNGDISNVAFLINYIQQYWGTIDNYLEKGYGYLALTDKKEIVSIAVSSSEFHSTHTVGVETLEGYKRQGLSSSLVKLLLMKFQQKNIAAWWDCMESNLASQKTAEKAGLVKVYRYQINWFYF